MPTPLALFDKITFSLSAELRGMPRQGREHLVGSFERSGWVSRRWRKRVELRVPLRGGRAELEACLFLSESAEEDGSSTVTVGSGSVVRLNGLRLLRAVMPEAAAPWRTLDDRDNVVGPTLGVAHELLPAQLGLVSEALEVLRQGFDDALVAGAGASRQELRLAAAELAVDSHWPESRAFVYTLDRCPMPGSLRVVTDSYRVQTVGGWAPCKAWFEGKARIYAKVYAKCEDLLRLEVAFATRRALEHVGSGVREVGGPEAVELLAELARVAHDRVARALRHVVAAQRGVRPMAMLLRELLPLADLAISLGASVGRPPKQPALDGANLALEALVTRGHFNGRNLRENSALRSALEKLCKPWGPLERARGNLYTVRPLVPWDADGGEAGEEESDTEGELAIAA